MKYMRGMIEAMPIQILRLNILALMFVSAATAAHSDAPPQGDGKLRIIAFGAHPDDCELRTAGTAARGAALGHHVKFVSVTNGDIGHWKIAGGPLGNRRLAEGEKCAKILGRKNHGL